MVRASAPFWLVLLALLGTGCFSSPGSEPSKTIPTLVAVAPQDFLGSVPCAAAPGALRTYVVRLFDHGENDDLDFELPAAVIDSGGAYRPVPCTQTAVFGHVAPPHKYSAIVEAYDRTDLRALGPGSPVLVDESGQHVSPRWTTRCGRDEAGNPTDGAVVSAHFTTRFVRGCAPLTSSAPPTDTAISVNVTDIAAAPGCGSGVGQVERFQVRFSGDPASQQEAACGESVTFATLEPGKGYSFELLAFEGGQTAPRWGTTCFRIALDGATVPAGCDGLSETGVLDIDVDALLAAWNLTCGAGNELQSVTATLGDTSVESCSSLRFDGLAPGSYTVDVTSERWDGAPSPGAVCNAEVQPGLIATASCTASAATP